MRLLRFDSCAYELVRATPPAEGRQGSAVSLRTFFRASALQFRTFLTTFPGAMKSKDSHGDQTAGHKAQRVAEMMEDLRSLGLKLTPQRRAIVEQFACDPTHPTAQELFDRLHRDFPSMSFATVYNTLDALTTANLAGTLRIDGHAARFDPNRLPHNHAVCDSCGRIVDIPAESLAPSAEAEASVRDTADGFHVRTVEQVYRGICGACARKARS